MKKKKIKSTNPQDKAPNFRKGNKLYMVFCHKCKKPNHINFVDLGVCAWCGDSTGIYDYLESIVKGKE
jgi:hypothetical protein